MTPARTVHRVAAASRTSSSTSPGARCARERHGTAPGGLAPRPGAAPRRPHHRGADRVRGAQRRCATASSCCSRSSSRSCSSSACPGCPPDLVGHSPVIDAVTPGRPGARGDLHGLHRVRPSPPGFERRYGVLRAARLDAAGPRRAAGGQDPGRARRRGGAGRAAGRRGVRAGLAPRRVARGRGRSCCCSGTATFSALGLLLAGTLRAEATLAVANGLYLLMLVAGGVVVRRRPAPGRRCRPWCRCCRPRRSGRVCATSCSTARPLPWAQAAVLVVWGGGGAWATARTFRWR